MRITTRRPARFAFAPALCAALCATVAVSCSAAPRDRADLVLGTVCSVRILDGGDRKALDAAFERLRGIEASMSANAEGANAEGDNAEGDNAEGNVVAGINAGAGAGPVAAPDDVRYVIRKALSYSTLSDGAFDPTIGPVVKLWNIGMDGERVPSPEEIAMALPLVDAGAVEVDDAAGTVSLARAGMRLDLGAIAKGYAADEVARVLLEHRVKAAVVDLGGNVKVVGKKPDGSPWRVGIQDPFDSRGARIGIAELEGGATVVTSGVYERYFIGDDGEHYHHILDPATGYPVRNGLASVTVISSSSIDADGLSTTLFSLGLERGMALVETLDHVEAVFIDEEKRVYLSSGAGAAFALDNPAFALAPLPLP